MKTTLLIFAAATLSALAAETVAFPFQVHGKKMPAGKYEVRNAGPLYSLRIVETGTGKSFYVTNASAKVGAKTMLNFKRYGDRFILASVTNNGADIKVPMSRSAAEIAMSTVPTATLAVTLSE